VSHPLSVKTLPTLEKVITLDQIQRYSYVSGDFNPVHLDEEFASRSSFGRLVAHGMLTLAFLSEMLTQAFGLSWIESGGLKVRFKRPAFPGDRLRTWGEITGQEELTDHTMVQCSIALLNSEDNGEIITGTARVRLLINQEIK